jgi:hypothetical protein
MLNQPSGANRLLPATGQKATTGGLIETVRSRGLISRPMSAFSAEGEFEPRWPAHPLRADAPTNPLFGRLVAITSHRDAVGWEQRTAPIAKVFLSKRIEMSHFE